jgi:hypothetical protein
MPKQVHTLNQFHGGVNLNSDPRDISDNQFSDSKDVAIDSVGRVKLMGAMDFGTAGVIGPLNATGGSATTLVIDSNSSAVDDYYNGLSISIVSGTGSTQTQTITNYTGSSKTVEVSDWDSGLADPGSGSVYQISPISTSALTPNYGLFTASSDRQIDGGSSDEFLVFNADGGSSIDVRDSEGWSIDGASTENISKPVYYNVDGNTRIADAALGINTQWFGYIGRTVFASLDATNTTASWVKTTAFPTAPTTGYNVISTSVTTTEAGTNTINNDYGEYEGNFLVVSGAPLTVATNAINLRTGILFNTSIKADGVATLAADLTLYPSSTHPATNYKDYGADGDATYAATEDVYPLFLNNNVLIGGIEGFDNTDDDYTTVINSAGLSYTIDEATSFVLGVYVWEAQRALVDYIEVRVGGPSTSDYYVYKVSGNDLIEGWNVVVCEQGMNTSEAGSPPNWGDTFNHWLLKVQQINASASGSTNAPKCYISGPVLTSNPGSVGYTPGQYSFHYTWLYDDDKQESDLFEFTGSNTATSPYEYGYLKTHHGNIMFTHDIYFNPKPSGTYGISERIVGSRIYYKKVEDDDHYLLFEYDFIDKGVKFFPEATSVNYTAVNHHESANQMDNGVVIKNIVSDTANVVDTYKNLNGYIGSNLLSTRCKTATVHGRRAYIGNVYDVTNSKAYPDRILKSMVNRFDVFLEDQSNVDVAIRDGENVVKLEAYADRILQFKEKTLYIINVSEGAEFLEDVYRHHGIAFPYHEVLTDKGVAWFNSFGVYFYDGRQVRNLLEKGGLKLIDEDNWNSFITSNDADMSNCGLAYLPKKHQLIIKNSDLDVYIYDFVMQAWTRGIDRIQAFHGTAVSNFALDNSNDAFFISGTNTNVATWQTDPQVSSNFMLQTKDIDFGSPAVRKKIYKVHVTYKTGNVYPNIRAYYDTNGGTAFTKVFADGTNYSTNTVNSYQSLDSANGWQTAVFKPATSSEANNIYSFALKFSVGTVTTGTAQSWTGGGIATGIKLASDVADGTGTDDYFNNMSILLTGGTGVGQVRVISNYVGSSKDATVSTWTTNPSSSTTYAIGVVPAGFEINDITIFYRMKTVT